MDNTDSRSDNSNVYNALASHDLIIYHPMKENVVMSEALNYAYTNEFCEVSPTNLCTEIKRTVEFFELCKVRQI